MPGFSLLDSELDCAILGKTTVLAAVREFQSLIPPAAVLCQALRGIWECSSDRAIHIKLNTVMKKTKRFLSS